MKSSTLISQLSCVCVLATYFATEAVSQGPLNPPDGAAEEEQALAVRSEPEEVSEEPSEGTNVESTNYVPWESGAENTIPSLPPETRFYGIGSTPVTDSPLSGTAIKLYFDVVTGDPYHDPDHLPPVADPNDFQSLHPLGMVSQQTARLDFLSNITAAPATLNFGLQARPGVFYDTGALTGSSTSFSPANIALSGTSHQAGQLMFLNFSQNTSAPIKITPGVQQNFAGGSALQINSEFLSLNDQQVFTRTAYGRVLSPTNENDFVAGIAPTLFGDLSALPILVTTGALPVGAVGIATAGSGYTGIAQLRYVRHTFNLYEAGDDFEVGLSAEDQSKLSDIANATNVLYRYPTFVSRIRYTNATNSSYQLAALARPIGFNDASFHDHFVTGWGLAGSGSVVITPQKNVIYIGGAGGAGVGDYIFGGSQAAVITNGMTISTLTTVGAYASYQRIWYQLDNTHNLSSNIAYGFVGAQTVKATDNRQLQQAWCNLLWNYSGNSAVGFEYQFGRRVTAGGQHGDDNRYMLVLQIGTQSSNNTAAARAVNAGATRSRSMLRL